MNAIARALWLAALILLLALPAGTARAHEVTAILALDPPVPPSGGSALLAVTLIDPTGKPTLDANVRASVSLIDEPPPPWVPFQQTGPVLYTARLQFPEGVAGVIRLETDLPDDQWHAMLQIRLGADWFQVKNLPLELQAGRFGSRGGQTASPPPGQGKEPLPPEPPAAAGRGAWVLLAGIVGSVALVLRLIRKR